MPTTPPPALGYGQRGTASLDTVNQWLRAQPDYQQLLRSWGQDPNNVKLNDWQKTAIVRLAQSKGVVVDEGGNGQEVDDSGNFKATSHNLRNGLIIAGIAAAAIAAPYAIPAIAGAGGAGGTAAGLAAVEGGGYGVGAGTVAALGTGAMAAVPVAGAVGAGAGVAGAGAAGAFDAAGNFIGPSTVSSVAPAAGGSSVIPWSTIIGAGSQLFGNLFAANQQGNAAEASAAAEAAAAKYSADKIAQANADALKFQYGTAENAYQNNEASRQGNYGIFAARERRLGTIGEEVGLGPREIPAYVPGVDPGFGTMGEAATGTAPAAGGAGNPRDPNAIMAALTKNYQALGVAPSGRGSGPTDIAYMAEEMAKTGGLTPENTGYWLGPEGRIAGELAKAKGGASTVQGAPVARAAAPATAATPFLPTAIRSGPQSIGYYA